MRSRNWCFTLNNPTSDEEPSQWPHLYMIYQLEEGANGTPHYQGYVRFDNAKTLHFVKQLSGSAHWEVRQGTHAQAKAYCSKEDTRIGEVYEDGEEPEQGKRSDLEEIRLKIIDGATSTHIADAHFGTWCRNYRAFSRYRILKMPKRTWKPRVTVLFGETGTGKSRLALEKHPGAFWKEKGPWWDGYEDHESVVIDEFYGWLPYGYLLRLLDRYPMTVEVKGGAVNFVATDIVLTSNQNPNSWYAFEYAQLYRRFDNVIQMTSVGNIIIKGSI